MRTPQPSHVLPLEVWIEDVDGFNHDLAEALKNNPKYIVSCLETVASEIRGGVVQILIASKANPITIKELTPSMTWKLVVLSGNITSTSFVKPTINILVTECGTCKTKKTRDIKFPFQHGGLQKCCKGTVHILGNETSLVDFRISKLEEECVYGDIPRRMPLYSDRTLCDISLGRSVIHGIYIPKVNSTCIYVLGIKKPDSELLTSINGIEADFKEFGARPYVYEELTKMFAPSIFGLENIKQSLLCQLFGGSTKIMQDSSHRRGDIHILLIGDPGMAKSQLLKFVQKVTLGVYTSGKGSSAAGLTASVVQNPITKKFELDPGAMVFGNGNVVCIDEFEKMNESDRTAIHEAMEQGTVSISKAGIVMTLPARTSVLAASNPRFGRWDDTKGGLNIDLIPTILSRFDLIFVLKDEHNKKVDLIMARHIIDVHTNLVSPSDLVFLREYIRYCRRTCTPYLSTAAIKKLATQYGLMRSQTGKIPITIRQLEAINRMTEALAKMQLKSEAGESHVEEALRLFKESTLDAAAKTNEPDIDVTDVIAVIENELKKIFTPRFNGLFVNDLINIMSGFDRKQVMSVIGDMVKRGKIKYSVEHKYLYK